MELQTIIPLEPPGFRIGYDTPVTMVGSCFVENIGERLAYFRFPVKTNPCGIVYNPLSVAESLEILLDGRTFTAADLWQRDGLWGSFCHHGNFSAGTAEECLRRINTRIAEDAPHLLHGNLLVITWGTAWVFHLRENGHVVSNCHRFPASDFLRTRLTVGEIVERYTRLLSRLHEANPRLRVLFTVSPIRHWKDGAHGNQLSKATLLLAADRLVHTFDFASYFPSYEIVMDELRDYRFYADDLLHIAPAGIRYIWERFESLYIADEARPLMKRIDKLNRLLAHRPSDPANETAIRLRAQAEQELKELGV